MPTNHLISLLAGQRPYIIGQIPPSALHRHSADEREDAEDRGYMIEGQVAKILREAVTRMCFDTIYAEIADSVDGRRPVAAALHRMAKRGDLIRTEVDGIKHYALSPSFSFADADPATDVDDYRLAADPEEVDDDAVQRFTSVTSVVVATPKSPVTVAPPKTVRTRRRKCDGAVSKPVASRDRDGALRAVAEGRLRILQCVFESVGGAVPVRTGTVKERAEQFGLSVPTVYQWLAKHDPADPLGSLIPRRLSARAGRERPCGG